MRPAVAGRISSVGNLFKSREGHGTKMHQHRRVGIQLGQGNNPADTVEALHRTLRWVPMQWEKLVV